MILSRSKRGYGREAERSLPILARIFMDAVAQLGERLQKTIVRHALARKSRRQMITRGRSLRFES